MHQGLSGLPRRVVIDTNVLLNAAFVAESSAQFSIHQLAKLGFSSIIDRAIEDEATSVLRRLRIRLGLPYDPAEVFRAYLTRSQILTLPRAKPFRAKSVNRADQHVVGTATHYDAWVLTGDIKLSAQCQGLHIATRSPWDVIMEAAVSEGRDPPLRYSLRVVGISASAGSFFARIVPGTMAGTRSVGRFTICDIQNVGRLYYDASPEEWVFSMAMGADTRLKCPLAPSQHWIVSASYEVGTQSDLGSATLRAAQPLGHSIQTNMAFKGNITAPIPGMITFGYSVNQTDYWNGNIKGVVLSPVPIDSKGWRALVKVPEAYPDPAASNVLKAALLRVRVAPDGLIVPSELSFQHSWL